MRSHFLLSMFALIPVSLGFDTNDYGLNLFKRRKGADDVGTLPEVEVPGVHQGRTRNRGGNLLKRKLERPEKTEKIEKIEHLVKRRKSGSLPEDNPNHVENETEINHRGGRNETETGHRGGRNETESGQRRRRKGKHSDDVILTKRGWNQRGRNHLNEGIKENTTTN
jgi:hypothetical protein